MGCTTTLVVSLLWVAVLFAVPTTPMNQPPAQQALVGRPYNDIVKGIQAMAESGHPAILQREYGEPYWSTLRVKVILRFQANMLWDVLVTQGAQNAPPIIVDVIDGIGGAQNIPHPPIDNNTAREQGFQTILAFLVPGAWLALLMKVYREHVPLVTFFTKLDAIYNKTTRCESRQAETRWRESRWDPNTMSLSLFISLDDIEKAKHERHETNLLPAGQVPWTVVLGAAAGQDSAPYVCLRLVH